jgi:hypothetical protein
MVLPSGIGLTDVAFRANPEYELICTEPPAAAIRAYDDHRQYGDDFYGFFQPRRPSHLSKRPASIKTALLFLSLLQPRTLPRHIAPALRITKDHLERLVLDNILEIEHDGLFVSGPAAAHLLDGKDRGPLTHLGRLSIDALQYAQHLVGLPVAIVAHRLYLYGALPATAALHRKYGDSQRIWRHITSTGALAPRLERYWLERAPRSGHDTPWRTWFFKGWSGKGEPRYKLYISPCVGDLQDIVNVTAETLLTVGGSVGFKIGRDIETLCRPDKMVAYFDDKEALRGAADSLAGRLGGRQAHGVPFTSQLFADGLLSWGADPPSMYAVSGTSESWRYWIVSQLARYLAAANVHADAMEPWQFAIQRLRLAGIDTDRWTPPAGAWSETLANS